MSIHVQIIASLAKLWRKKQWFLSACNASMFKSHSQLERPGKSTDDLKLPEILLART